MDYNAEFDSIVGANKGVFEVKNEDCPMGDDCSIHFRTQERYMEEEYQCARYIDYVGDYVVITDTVPITPTEALRILLGTPSPAYETLVVYVGSEALAATQELSDDEFESQVVSYEQFDEFDDFVVNHLRTVMNVEQGIIPGSE